MHGWSFSDRVRVHLPVDDGVEATVRVGGVVDRPAGPVGFDQAVGAADDTALAGLLLTLDVPGHRVVDVVCEGVLGVGVVLLHPCERGGASRCHQHTYKQQLDRGAHMCYTEYVVPRLSSRVQ